MCGIIVAYPASNISIDYLSHRGPDSHGIINLPNISLGHTRLAILDLSDRASQPIRSSDGKVLVTYNGEIYNFRQLGLPTESSDTVALVEWLSRSGPDFDPGLLDGMYAFAAYFPDQESLIICRDPVGIKPLYLAISEDGGHLAISSEIKGFFGIDWFKPQPTMDAAIQADFLQYGYAVPRPVNVTFRGRHFSPPLSPTLIANVFQVCPGQKLTFSLHSAPSFSFFEVTAPYQSPLDALTDSVKEQSISDVEVGVQLSGGIDSSLVAYHYALNNPAVHGFYVSVQNKDLNEDCWAEQAAERLTHLCQFSFHTIAASQEEMLRVLPWVIWYMDEPPIRHPNALGVYLLCEYVRQHTAVKVLLTGEGADEVFAGYDWHDGKAIQEYDRSRRLFDIGGSDIIRQYLMLHEGRPLLERQVLFDRDIYLPPILARQDRMSMAHSLESRVPFLSNRFLAMPPPLVPGKMALKRKAAEVFNSHFAARPKSGFGFPVSWLGEITPPANSLEWLRGSWVPKTPFQRWVLGAIGLWAEDYLGNGWKKKHQAQQETIAARALPQLKDTTAKLAPSSAPIPEISDANLKKQVGTIAQEEISQIHEAILPMQQSSQMAFHKIMSGQSPSIPATVLKHEGNWSVCLAGGNIWRLDTSQYLDNEIIKHSHFELETTRLIHHVVKPGMIVFDVGANFGYFTVQLSKLVGPSGRVYAFEPSVRFNERLNVHLQYNQCSNVSIYPVGLSDRPGEFVLHEGGDSATLAWHDDAKQPIQSAMVKVQPLDSYLQALNLPRLDFIKVDIDGAEPLFLKGAQETLRRYRPFMVLEFMQLGLLEVESDVSQLAEQLVNLGYVLISEKTRQPYASRVEFLREAMNCSHSINVICQPAASPESLQGFLRKVRTKQYTAPEAAKSLNENPCPIAAAVEPINCTESSPRTVIIPSREDWDSERKKDFRPWLVTGNSFSSFLEKYLPVNSTFRCAEIGAYPGEILCYLAKQFQYLPVAIEYSQYCQHIEQLLIFNGIREFQIINQDFFEVSQEQFDVVTSFGFVEHFTNYQQVIDHHFHLLKPGGYLVIEVPRIDGFQGSFYELTYTEETWNKVRDSHNREIMNLHTLKRSISRNGGEFLFADYVGGGSIYFHWTDKFIKPEMRWLVKYLNAINEYDKHAVKSDAFYSPYIFLIARKGTIRHNQRLEEANNNYQQARQLITNHDWKNAEIALRRCIELDPDCIEAYEWLSDVLWRSGNPSGAVGTLEKAPKVMPSAMGVLQRLAFHYHEQNKLVEAEKILLEALSWAPRSKAILTELIKIYNSQKRFSEEQACVKLLDRFERQT